MPEPSDLPDSGGPTTSAHPAALVPDALFDDPAAERRWRARYSATRMSLPSLARDAQHRAVYVSNATGRYEVYSWDVTTDRHAVLTDRPDGTAHAQLSADGEHVWWFDDTAGDEFGVWRVQPFGSGPATGGHLSDGPAGAAQGLPGATAGYPAGLEVGHRGDARRVCRRRRHPDPPGNGPGLPRRSSTSTPRTAGSVRCPPTRRSGCFRIPSTGTPGTRHCGRSRCRGGDVVGELSDAPGEGLIALMFSPVPGISGYWSGTSGGAATNC